MYIHRPAVSVAISNTILVYIYPTLTHFVGGAVPPPLSATDAASAASAALRLLAMPRCTTAYHAPPESAIARPRMACHDFASPKKIMLITTTTTCAPPSGNDR